MRTPCRRMARRCRQGAQTNIARRQSRGARKSGSRQLQGAGFRVAPTALATSGCAAGVEDGRPSRLTALLHREVGELAGLHTVSSLCRSSRPPPQRGRPRHPGYGHRSDGARAEPCVACDFHAPHASQRCRYCSACLRGPRLCCVPERGCNAGRDHQVLYTPAPLRGPGCPVAAVFGLVPPPHELPLAKLLAGWSLGTSCSPCRQEATRTHGDDWRRPGGPPTDEPLRHPLWG
jgi:hypothetical protein